MKIQCEHSKEQHPLAKSSALQMYEQVMLIGDTGPLWSTPWPWKPHSDLDPTPTYQDTHLIQDLLNPISWTH